MHTLKHLPEKASSLILDTNNLDFMVFDGRLYYDVVSEILVNGVGKSLSLFVLKNVQHVTEDEYTAELVFGISSLHKSFRFFLAATQPHFAPATHAVVFNEKIRRARLHSMAYGKHRIGIKPTEYTLGAIINFPSVSGKRNNTLKIETPDFKITVKLSPYACIYSETNVNWHFIFDFRYLKYLKEILIAAMLLSAEQSELRYARKIQIKKELIKIFER